MNHDIVGTEFTLGAIIMTFIRGKLTLICKKISKKKISKIKTLKGTFAGFQLRVLYIYKILKSIEYYKKEILYSVSKT